LIEENNINNAENIIRKIVNYIYAEQKYQDEKELKEFLNLKFGVPKQDLNKMLDS
jgi:hypothetical protein